MPFFEIAPLRNDFKYVDLSFNRPGNLTETMHNETNALKTKRVFIFFIYWDCILHFDIRPQNCSFEIWSAFT